MRSSIAAQIAIATLFGTSACADATDTPATPAYALLDEAGTKLREDFNRAGGSVRLLFVVDPVCAVCLRGLDDLNRALFASTDDPRLQTFVVHVPVIGAEAKDILPASRLLPNPHVRHYWNPSGAFGRQLAEATGLRRGDELVYAWDVWLIYGPNVTWDGALPPRPQRLMHQLPTLQGNAEFPRLDAGAFARETRRLIAELPALPTRQ